MTAQKNVRARYKKEEASMFSVLMASVRVLCVSVIMLSLLMLLLAAVLIRLGDPVAYIDAAAWGCLLLCCIVGGYVSRIISQNDYVRVSLLSGVMLVLLLFILSLATGGITSILYTAVGYLLAVLLHFVGALAAEKLLGSRRRRRSY